MEEMETANQPNTTIFDLGIDNMRKIFSYLQLFEKMIVITACNSYEDLLVESMQNEFLVMVDFIRFMSVEEAREIFSYCGRYIKQLRIHELINNYELKFYQLIVDYCVNVEILELNCPSRFEFALYVQIFLAAKNIKSLRIERFVQHPVYPTVGNKMCAAISTLSGLERLVLVELRGVTGEHLAKLNNLSELNISLCRLFDPANFIDIMRSNKLKILSIAYCNRLDNDALTALVETQRDLEELVISGTLIADLEIVCQLPKLKRLALYVNPSTRCVSILDEYISIDRTNELESLKIIHNDTCPCPTLPIPMGTIVSFGNLKELHFPDNFVVYNAILDEVALKLTQMAILRIKVEIEENSFPEEGIIRIVKNLKYLREFYVLSNTKHFDEKLLLQLVQAKRSHGDYGTIFLKIYWDWMMLAERQPSLDILKSKCYRENVDVLKVVPVYDWCLYEKYIRADDRYQ